MHLFVALSIVTASMGAARPDVSVVPRPSVASFVAGAAEQVKRCYRSPRVSRAARRITTRLLVRYTSDGMLAGLPVWLSQDGVTPEGRPFAERRGGEEGKGGCGGVVMGERRGINK